LQTGRKIVISVSSNDNEMIEVLEQLQSKWRHIIESDVSTLSAVIRSPMNLQRF